MQNVGPHKGTILLPPQGSVRVCVAFLSTALLSLAADQGHST